MEITLIKGTEAHIPDCTRCLKESELGQNYFPGEGQAESAVREFLGTDYFLVAVDENGAFKGFLCYLPKGSFHSFPYLHLLAAPSSERGRGIGTMIMDRFEALVSEKRDKLFLVVADFNPKGCRFYKNRGYTEIGVIPSLYRKDINEHLMMKTFS